jgi:hypothetical protein
MHALRRRSISLGILVIFMASLACALPTSQPQNPGLDQTSVALAVEQTGVANDKGTLAAREAVTATPAPTQTQPAATGTSLPPSATPQPSDTSQPPTATLEPSATAVDIDAKIKGANVLVFEDMAGNFNRKPLVHQAVNEMNFSGGRVIEVYDALGNFKEQLLSTTRWDLIVVAAEYRSGVQGEFWQYIYDQLDRGAAVAIEVWYLDKHYTDIEPIFKECGIEYQKNWDRGDKYNILDYAIYWLQPDHEFLQPPQVPVSLGNPNYLYWVPPLTYDAGDLIQIGSGGDAVLLAGTLPSTKSMNGVLATCLQGRLIVQTFSTHDYKSSEVVALWKNYMRYTLTNHFLRKK